MMRAGGFSDLVGKEGKDRVRTGVIERTHRGGDVVVVSLTDMEGGSGVGGGVNERRYYRGAIVRTCLMRCRIVSLLKERDVGWGSEGGCNGILSQGIE